MRIGIVISSMGPGGAERVVSRLSADWVGRGRQVSILTLSPEPSFYELDARVEYIALDLMAPSGNKWAGAISNVGRLRVLRKTIRSLKPDVIISFMDKTNILVLLATRGLGIPVIISERTYPGSYRPGVEWEAMRRAAYRFASCVVAVTNDMRTALERRGIRNIEVIPNPVVPIAASGSAIRDGDTERGAGIVMAAGRLEHLKGFDLLIESFASLHRAHPGWELVIVGQGELRDELTRQAGACGAAHRIRFPGIVDDLPKALAEVQIFVLCSRNEGFPNVLVEAMAAGKAVVAADCLSGPREIISHGDNGLLVPVEDAGALARALDQLMSDAGLRQRLGESARKVAETYSLDGVMQKWDRIVDEAIAA